VESILFQGAAHGAVLQLTDFGSRNMDAVKPNTTANNSVNTMNGNEMATSNMVNEEKRHSTLAGTAIYISPELLQRTCTQKDEMSGAPGWSCTCWSPDIPPSPFKRPLFNATQRS